MKISLPFAIFLVAGVPLFAGDLPKTCRQFLDSHCTECHDADTRKGGLDLTALKFDLAQATNFAKWVLVHDRVHKGEMPPKKKPRPEVAELATFIRTLAG